MKNIAVVTHKYLPQPDDDLIFYLNREKNVYIANIRHSFSDAKDRFSILKIYINGKKQRSIKSSDYYSLPDSLIHFKELIFTMKWILSSKEKFDVYIGIDGLCTLFGLILKKLGKCRKVIYWSTDFVPFNRFKDKWKNFLYHKVNTFSCKNSDEVWDLSPRMAKGRKKYLKVKYKDYKLHRIVPYGVWTDRIKAISYDKCQKHTLVFMGHLLKKQGIDMIIKKIPDIMREIPNFELKIIGDGNYKNQLERLVDILEVKNYCTFLGRVSDRRYRQEIAKSAVAIASYYVGKNSYTYYADPGKVKTYLACGVPVLLTNLPWNAKEIENNKCGIIIKDDGSDLVSNLIKIMDPLINKEYRKNAIKYAQNFDYEKIFSNLNI